VSKREVVHKLFEEKTDTRSKIIEAAAEIIGKERNLNLTIREIAGRAEVNIASINYYFRSKDNLMEEVEHLMLDKIKSIYNNLFDETTEARDRLINWADKLMKHLLDSPGILYMIGTRVLQKESMGLTEYLSLLETGLTPVVKELTGITDKNALSFKVMHLISGVVYPVLIHSTTDKTAGVNINNDSARRKYISSLIAGIE
jgi:TetR/AcrR family transcriptional regulator, regulator of cefoperazone and chloramphenicol sensitivity